MYYDEEEDYVTFSTDLEWEECLRSHNKNNILYLKTVDKQKYLKKKRRKRKNLKKEVKKEEKKKQKS